MQFQFDASHLEPDLAERLLEKRASLIRLSAAAAPRISTGQQYTCNPARNRSGVPFSVLTRRKK
jgi:hypothetical protein